MTPGTMLVLVAVLIGANALFVAGEFALVATRRGVIEEMARDGDRRARVVLRELQQLSFVLSAAQFGITVTSLLVGFLAEDAIGDTLVAPVVRAIGLGEGSAKGASVAAAFLISTMVQMIVGELAPKNVAIARPEQVALAVAVPMRAFGVVFGPIIRVFDRAAAWMTERVFGVEVSDELAGGHTLDELSRIIRASSEEGVFSGEQAELLSRAVGLGDRRVAEVMIPSMDIRWIEADLPMSVLREASRETGFSRFPVRAGDEIVGTIHIKDLMRPGVESLTVGAVADPCLVVPESEPLRRLLARFRGDRRTFALVVDEFGGTAGLATLEDVLEQLVGDIEDEFDPDRAPAIRRLGRGRFLVSGGLRLDRLERAIGLPLPRGDYETVAGLVMDGLGRIPEVDEVLEVDGARFRVTRMSGVRIAEVEAVLEAPPAGVA